MAVSFGPKIPSAFVSALLGDNYYTAGEALLRMLQALVQANVISVGSNTPPGSPANGDTYAVGTAPTGAWASNANSIAYWSTDNPAAPGGEWEFYAPVAGWVVGNQTDHNTYIFNGSTWAATAPPTPQLPQTFSPVAGEFLAGYTAGTGLFTATQLVQAYVPCAYVAGTFAASQVLLYIPVDRTVSFAANFAGSQADLQVAAASTTVFTIWNGTAQIGTITFEASAGSPPYSSGVFASTGGLAQSLTAGQILSVVAPASPDAAAAGLGFSLSGTR